MVVEGTIPDYVSIRPKFNRPRSRFRPSIDCFRRCTREKQIFIVSSDGGNGFFPGEYASRHFRGRGSEGKRQINVEIEFTGG